MMNTQQRCDQYETSRIHDQTNARIFNRFVPSQSLQPYLDVRPMNTKYTLLPIVEPRKPISTPLVQYPVYTELSPGLQRNAPWSGYSSKVNDESILRNQIFALQKCSQAVYVPTSQSDLYQYHFEPTSQQQVYPGLFKKEQFYPFNPNPNSEVGNALFLNSTRVQLREVTNDCRKK